MKKNKKVIKMVYGGVTVPPSDNAQAYSSFAPQAPIMDTGMSAPIMDTNNGYRYVFSSNG
jgi:hypothetical protein